MYKRTEDRGKGKKVKRQWQRDRTEVQSIKEREKGGAWWRCKVREKERRRERRKKRRNV